MQLKKIFTCGFKTTMEEQWKDIRLAYKRIVQHACNSPEEQERVNAAILKLIAAAVDLSLCGDPVIRNAINALLGSREYESSRQEEFHDSESLPNHHQGSTLPNAHEHPNPATSNPSEVPNVPHLFAGNTPGQSIPNGSDIFQFMERIMNGGINGIIESSSMNGNSHVTNEEFRNLFPLWHMFERATENQIPRRSSNDDSENVETG
jgi:hypothetical protein